METASLFLSEDVFKSGVGNTILEDARKSLKVGDLSGEEYEHLKRNLSVVCGKDIPPAKYRDYIDLVLPLVYKTGEWQAGILHLKNALSKKTNRKDKLVGFGDRLVVRSTRKKLKNNFKMLLAFRGQN